MKFVILAKAGIQFFQAVLDARLRTAGMTKIKKAIYGQTRINLGRLHSIQCGDTERLDINH
jgi:hypothetical protein